MAIFKLDRCLNFLFATAAKSSMILVKAKTISAETMPVNNSLFAISEKNKIVSQ
jgi:hypothetical protein